MRVQTRHTGQILDLSPNRILGRGGEATIYAVPELQAAAKLYHSPSTERVRKLEIMVANPPAVPGASERVVFAWPLDLLVAGLGPEVVGFLMPRVANMRSIADVYHPRTRKLRCPGFTYLYLHRAARNLAAAVGAAHARGYVIGDVNESNVLVEDTALVALVDTDSFQVHGGGVTFRCPVGRPEFTPPELQGVTFSEVTRTAAHDRFGLGVLIFQLLMEGTHPFAGVYRGDGDPPGLDARISDGAFPYARGDHAARRIVPAPLAPPFEILDPELRRLAVRCFADGHGDPSSRPDALEWQRALDRAAESLVVCRKSSWHRHGSHLGTCPWCARTRLLHGLDPFPSPHARPAPAPKPRPPAPDFEKILNATKPQPLQRPGRGLSWAAVSGIFLLFRLVTSLVPSRPTPSYGPNNYRPPVGAGPRMDSRIPAFPAVRGGPQPVVIVNGGSAVVDIGATAAARPPQFVRIQPGEFWMGCAETDTECDVNEKPRHRVRIAEAFEIGTHEVTREEWLSVLDKPHSTPSLPQGASWNEAQTFLKKLNTRGDGYRYRLPTEEEWEYAARAGTQGAYARDGDTRPGTAQMEERGWYLGNSGQRTRPVGQKQPNAWGLYDMAGNVWEWTEDAYAPYGQAPAADTPSRVVRGGSAAVSAKFARVSSRISFFDNYRNLDVGFRYVRVPARNP